MTFTYIDGIFLGIILIFVLIGLFRGFLKSVLAFCGTLVKLVISFFLCKPVANLISNWTQADDRLISKFYTWASGLSDAFNVNLVGMNQAEIDSSVNVAITDGSFPRILRGLCKNILQISPETLAGNESVTIANIISIALARVVLVVICFVAIFVLLYIVLFILKRIMKRVFENNKFLFKTDKTLGAVIGLVEGVFAVTVLFGIVSIFKNADFMTGFFNTFNHSCIASPVSNWIMDFVERYLDFGGTLTNIIKK